MLYPTVDQCNTFGDCSIIGGVLVILLETSYAQYLLIDITNKGKNKPFLRVG
jgi:hypothetical protein